VSLESVFTSKTKPARFMSANVRLDFIVRLKMRVKMASQLELFGTARQWTLELSYIKLYLRVNRYLIGLHES
jgi:hypothetical protein